MARRCESLRTATLKIKHVAVMMEVGAQGRIGKEIRFNCLDVSFFSFLLSPFKQTPDGHPAGMTISLLRFWQPPSPCRFSSLSTKKKEIEEGVCWGVGADNWVHNYHSKPWVLLKLANFGRWREGACALGCTWDKCSVIQGITDSLVFPYVE